MRQIGLRSYLRPVSDAQVTIRANVIISSTKRNRLDIRTRPRRQGPRKERPLRGSAEPAQQDRFFPIPPRSARFEPWRMRK